MASKRLVDFLQRCGTYSETTHSVELIETHISWIFLTDEFAYKLKKPVRFGFLDFSTPDLRREACECEVRLNTRLAPTVYLGVVPIGLSPSGELRLGDEATPIDWLVKMRRLPSRNALDVLIREDRVSPTAIDELAKTLSDFYDNTAPAATTEDSYRANLERHVSANHEELLAAPHSFEPSQIHRIHSAQLRVLRLVPNVFDERVRNGRIVEGHGDLRPEHIYFTPAPLIIDCIEFSLEYRTLDIVDELAFLDVECDFLQAENLVDPIFEAYFRQSGDSPPRTLIDFYRIYRACVRAKVSALRAEQLTGDARSQSLAAASKYVELADRYSRILAPPLVIVVHGLPGTGKSTIAQSIRDRLGFELLQTDVIRQSLFGPSGDQVGFNEGRYQPENRLRVYTSLHDEAARLLSMGTSVVLDGTYLAASLRGDAADLAARHRAAFLTVHCQCSDEIAARRIRARASEGTSLSETRPEYFARQRAAEEQDSPQYESLAIDTSANTAEPIPTVFEAIRKKCFGGLIDASVD